jgi:hypothetical protein
LTGRHIKWDEGEKEKQREKHKKSEKREMTEREEKRAGSSFPTEWMMKRP